MYEIRAAQTQIRSRKECYKLKSTWWKGSQHMLCQPKQTASMQYLFFREKILLRDEPLLERGGV